LHGDNIVNADLPVLGVGNWKWGVETLPFPYIIGFVGDESDARK